MIGKTLLRSALNEMWQAELHLRQAEPAKALPFEYRALAFIKKVQQAERIYLARVGPELPPIDESRRLGGDRSGFKAPEDLLRAADREDAPLLVFWQSLDAADLILAHVGGMAACASCPIRCMEFYRNTESCILWQWHWPTNGYNSKRSQCNVANGSGCVF